MSDILTSCAKPEEPNNEVSSSDEGQSQPTTPEPPKKPVITDEGDNLTTDDTDDVLLSNIILKKDEQKKDSCCLKDKKNDKMPIISKINLNNDKLANNYVVDIPNNRSLTLDELVNNLTKVLNKGHYTEPNIFNTVDKLMRCYNINNDLNDYKKYILWKKNEYTRNLISKTDKYTLMLLCWPNNICSPIHDHGGSECWLRVVSGKLEERFYHLPNGNESIKMKFKQTHSAGAVCFINDKQGLHCIACSDQRRGSISLHCYVPGYVECHGYFDEKNAEKGKRKCKLNFTSVNGKVCKKD